jgi:curved DNA-binding protein CbpA
VPAPPDPYAVLGVPRNADGPAIHAAYRRAVRQTHPDAGGSAAAFEAVQDAYEALRDPARRAAHERNHSPRRPPPPPPQAPPRVEPDARSAADLRAESQRLENEAREMAGLPPRDYDGETAGGTGDSFAAIIDDAGKQIGDIAQAASRELRRRLRRWL